MDSEPTVHTLETTGRKVCMGCIGTPRHQLAKAYYAFRRAPPLPDPPDNFDGTGGVKDWDMAGNDSYGDCVTAEEANFKRCIGKVTGADEVEIPTTNVINWAKRHGFLNGANLDDVLNAMQIAGLVDSSGVEHKDGSHGTIDWTDQREFKLSVQYFKGLKIAVGASQLLQVVGDGNGWVLNGARSDQTADHCVGIYGYGKASFLATVCGLPNVPAGLDPNTFCVLLYTWGTIGIVTWASSLAITSEAWVRITDPDRGDKATWDVEANDDFTAIANVEPHPTPEPGPTPGPRPPTRRAAQAIHELAELFAEYPEDVLELLQCIEDKIKTLRK